MTVSKGKFAKINDEYHKLTMDFFSKKVLIKDTSHGTYAAAACSTIQHLFQKLRLARYKHFCDLGSGDGRVTAIASTFTNSTGIECDQELIKISNKIMKKLKLTRCNYIEGNYLEHDLSKYDVIFINPDGPLYKLEKKLRKEFKGTLVVFNCLYEPLNLNKKEELFIDMVKIGIYEVA